MKMKKKLLAVLAGAMLIMATSAMATQFDFSYSGTNIHGSGQLTATDNGGGHYTATSGSSTVIYTGSDLGAFSLLSNPNAPGFTQLNLSGGYFQYNDLVNSSTPFLDWYGVLFTNSTTNTGLNIYYNNPQQLYSADLFTIGGAYRDITYNSGVTFTLAETSAPVPEPGTMMLLGIGLAGLAVYGKRRMNKDA